MFLHKLGVLQRLIILKISHTMGQLTEAESFSAFLMYPFVVEQNYHFGVYL